MFRSNIRPFTHNGAQININLCPMTLPTIHPPCSTPPPLTPRHSRDPHKMGIAKHRSTRSERLTTQAFLAVKNGAAMFRTAAQNCCMALSTLHRHYLIHSTQTADTPTVSNGRKPVLSLDEENMIVQTLQKYSNRGFPLSREDLCDCV